MTRYEPGEMAINDLVNHYRGLGFVQQAMGGIIEVILSRK